MTDHNSSFPVGSSYSHNGPVCQICGQGYIGNHTCKVSVLRAKIAQLEKMIEQIESKPKQMPCSPIDTNPWIYPTTVNPGWNNDRSGCPCRKENGGSGICGCIMGGPQVIC